MAQFKNKVNVSINDQLFTIVGEDNPEHIRYVAHLVDDKIKELGYKAAGLDTSRKAILTAVNIMHEKSTTRRRKSSFETTNSQIAAA
ncbi:TPA: cell division protein ZapA [Staphylococcus aureus]